MEVHIVAIKINLYKKALLVFVWFAYQIPLYPPLLKGDITRESFENSRILSVFVNLFHTIICRAYKKDLSQNQNMRIISVTN